LTLARPLKAYHHMLHLVTEFILRLAYITD
jgi:hypothetical protein